MKVYIDGPDEPLTFGTFSKQIVAFWILCTGYTGGELPRSAPIEVG